jgi:hypothetical protein
MIQNELRKAPLFGGLFFSHGVQYEIVWLMAVTATLLSSRTYSATMLWLSKNDAQDG